jgi:hypothetical protein
MHPVLTKTFGGLSRSYYFRHFVFGLIFPMFVLLITRGAVHVPIVLYPFLAVSTLLYPYSRFVYEGIAGFIIGENFFWVNAFLLLWWKAFTMALCWCFAIVVAPVGLAYLYYQSKKGRS